MKAAGRPKTQRRDPQGRFVTAKPRKPAKANGRKGPFKPGDNKPVRKPAVPKRITAKVLKGRKDPNEVRRTYHDVLTRNFTAKERKKILDEGVHITVRDLPGDALAETALKDGKIHLEVSPDGLDEETLTHETIHMLQDIGGGRTAEERTVFSAMSGSRNLNEAMVEAETICRVKDPRSEKGYYGYLNVRGKIVRNMKEEDKAVISSSKRGNCAAKVQDKFDQTHISGMRNDFDGETAKSTRKRLKFWRR